MKKWFIILIAFLQLSSTTQLSQLYKVPVFFYHFSEHSHNTFSFDELETFLIHHYGGHEMDEDWETDQKLPFMNADRVHLEPCYISQFYFTISQSFSFHHNSSNIITENQTFISKYLNSIWQPPKIS